MQVIIPWDEEDWQNRQITQRQRLDRFVERAADCEEMRGNVEKAGKIRSQSKPKLPWVT